MVIVVIGRVCRMHFAGQRWEAHRTGVSSTGAFRLCDGNAVYKWTRYAPGVRLEDVVVSTTQDPPRRRFVKMPMSKRHRKERTSEGWRLRTLRRIVSLLAAAPTGEQRRLTCRPPRVLGLAASVGASAKARSWARGGVHRFRVLSGLAPVACGVLLMLAALPAEALASTNWATGVEASLPANARTNPDVYGLAVSCASAGNCTGVGDYFDSSGRLQGVLLSETSGTWAAGVEPSLPANAGANPSVSVYRVSCASAGNCAAVGGYTDSSGHSQGLLLGTAVSAASALALIGRPTSNDARVTDKLSCAPSALAPCRRPRR